MSKHTQKATGNSVIFFMAIMIANVFGYLTRGVLTRVLSPADFGLFYAVIAFLGFVVAFLDFGYTPALIKFISEYKARKKKRKFK